MEYKFLFLLKTYQKDFIYMERLLKSFHRYNKDHIPLYIVVSSGEKKAFYSLYREYLVEDITLFEEKEVCGYLIEENTEGLSSGYLNQEIIKLSFWETGYATNYCCIDSETTFIRNFYIRDFMYNEMEPYTVLLEDNDLHADPVYYKAFWRDREKSIQRIQDALNYHPYKLLTCHGYQIMSTQVLKDFKIRYMETKGLTYSDLLQIAPLEFTWYNLWLQKEKVIPIHFSEPLFKTFHMKHHYNGAWLNGIEEHDWARGYVGYVLQSNFFQEVRVMTYEDAKRIPFLFSKGKIGYAVKSVVYSWLIQLKQAVGALSHKIMNRR